MMKKLASGLLALTFACLCAAPAYAANSTGRDTTITTEAQAAYTVTIPEKLEIPYNSTEAKPLTLTASDVLLEDGKKVSVTAAGSGANGAFTMANGSHTLAYELSRAASPWSAILKDGEVASFTENGTAAIYAKVPDWNLTAAGKYSGTITFTVSYQNQ